MVAVLVFIVGLHPVGLALRVRSSAAALATAAVLGQVGGICFVEEHSAGEEEQKECMQSPALSTAGEEAEAPEQKEFRIC